MSRKQKFNSRQRPQDMTELSTNYVLYLQETQIRNYLVFKHSIKRFIDYQFFFCNYDYFKKKIVFMPLYFTAFLGKIFYISYKKFAN